MEIGFWQIGLLCIAAFCAGLIDAMAGEGGLIQTPAGLIILASQKKTTDSIPGILRSILIFENH